MRLELREVMEDKEEMFWDTEKDGGFEGLRRDSKKKSNVRECTGFLCIIWPTMFFLCKLLGGIGGHENVKQKCRAQLTPIFSSYCYKKSQLCLDESKKLV